MGTQVVIPYREEDEKRHLKPTGDLGQIVPMAGWHPTLTIDFTTQIMIYRNGTFAMNNRLKNV